VILAGLAMLGGVLPLAMASGVPTYAAVFRPGADVRSALASVAQAGAAWRVLRVVASHPAPILILARGTGDGRWPAALLVPVPAAPFCLSPVSGL
jgi:hypothetical protein